MVRGAAPSGADSGELGTSSSMAARGMVGPARRGVSMGGTIGVSSESKKSKSSVGWGEAAKGKNCLIKDHVSGDHETIS
jgi:hypothetical protein